MLGDKQGGCCNNPLALPLLPSPNHKGEINFYTSSLYSCRLQTHMPTLRVIAFNVTSPFTCFLFVWS